MAALNFPNSPSTNDIHSENGVSFKWNGTIWKKVGSTYTDTTNLNVTGIGTFAGAVNIAGVLTYEDVKNVDSVGIVTARTGIHIDDSITHIGDTNTKIRFPAVDTFTVETAGAERLRITSDGQLLHSANKSTGYTARFNQAHADNPAEIEINSPNDNNLRPASIQLMNNGTDKWGIGQVYASTSSGAFHLCAGSTSQSNSKFTITTAGLVGIGTINPSTSLHAYGGSSGFRLEREGSNPGYYQIAVSHGTPSGTNNYGSAYFTLSQNTGDYVWKSASAERMRLKASGSLGIGEDAPDTVLHIKHPTSNNVLKLESGDGTVSMEFYDNATTNGNQPIIGGIGNNFFVETGGSERLRITSDGNVLIKNSTTSSAGSNEGNVPLCIDGGTNKITLMLGDGSTSVSSHGVNDYSGAIRYNGSNVAWGDIAYYPNGDGAGGSFRFTRNGSTISSTPNARIGASGIFIGGTADANNLDHYEEGSWTPSVMDGNSSNVSFSNGGDCRFVKIGRLVYCYFNVTRAESGSKTGTMSFYNLPFTSHNTTLQVTGTWWLDESQGSGDDSVGGAMYVQQNSKRALFVYPTSEFQPIGSSYRYLQFSHWQDGRPIYGSFTYMAQA